MKSVLAHTGYAPVNGLNMYYEIHGAGEPLVLLHGGFGLIGMFDALLAELAKTQQVIAADLQGHGRTADINRPLRLESMGDDVAELIRHLGFAKADIVGYSMGGGVALRTAIQHSEVVRKLVVVSTVFKRAGWYSEMLVNMDQMSAAAAPFLKDTPMYHAYIRVAPQPGNFTLLVDKMGDMLRQDFDWSHAVAALQTPTMIVIGDADSMPPAHATEFFGLLGGGKRDGSWDRSGMSKSQLAILPGTTHYDIFTSPMLAPLVIPFLDAPRP